MYPGEPLEIQPGISAVVFAPAGQTDLDAAVLDLAAVLDGLVFDNFEIVVVALWEGGEHGQFAAALVRDVFKAYVDKKTRLGKSLMAKTPGAVTRGASDMANPPAPSPTGVRDPGTQERPNRPPATTTTDIAASPRSRLPASGETAATGGSENQ